MACLRSPPPFVMETNVMLLLHSRNKRKPLFSFLSYKPRNSIDAFCLSEFNNNKGKRLWRSVKPLRADPSDSSMEGLENVLQATVEQNKKFHDMENDLLQLIAEREKLVSAIKSIEGEVSREIKDNFFHDVVDHDAASSSDEDDSIIETPLSCIDVSEITSEVQQNQFFDATRGFPESIQGLEEKVQPAILNTNSETVWSDPITSFLPNTDEETANSKDNEQNESNFEFDNKETEPRVVENEQLVEKAKPPPLAGPNVMNVVLVAAECAPWSKTGGLGDVAGSLPKALARRGHRVMVVTPMYGNYTDVQDTGVRKRYKVDGQTVEVSYFHAYVDGVDFVFIDCHMFRHMENTIYQGKREDILKRMALLCKISVEVPWHVPCGGACYGDGNLVFIANDWHTALLPVYLKAYYRDNGLMTYTRSVLVIHNIAHQGRGPLEDFRYTDLPGHYLDLFKMYDPLGGEHFNTFAAGLKAADRIVTVSHGYAWELKTTEGGWGLHNIINEFDWKFSGIVNGIDTKDWNPQHDIHLTSDGYTNYSLENLQAGKLQCKAALQKELGLPIRPEVPLISFIGRLDGQKGVDLIGEAFSWMMDQDVQLVMLGTGRPDLEKMLKDFEGQHRDKVRGWVGFCVKTAHRITAGADILLMPSRFEPCGLNQLYAMSYGTIPVVHAVGGLKDTVQPFDPFNDSGLGWTFDSAETSKLIDALGNCLLTFREYKDSWEGLMKRGMTQDHSWDHAAKNYEDVLVAAKYQW
ncbi:hypothetical protein ACFE04_006112 [Oxalis oulophora]